jgi:hypothetical protein
LERKVEGVTRQQLKRSRFPSAVPVIKCQGTEVRHS